MFFYVCCRHTVRDSNIKGVFILQCEHVVARLINTHTHRLMTGTWLAAAAVAGVFALLEAGM